MRFSKKHNSNEDSFWLSATDMMAGILIVVLLLMMLFLLYLNDSKDEVWTPLGATEYAPGDDNQERPFEDETQMYIEIRERIEGGEGATEADDQNAANHAPTERPTEARKTGENGYDEKAAVFVTVVDADSGNVIKKSGITFELYAYKNGIGGLQTLNSYYQERIEYNKFETGEGGTFYLPEKITKGWYSLRNISAPEGYFTDEEVEFEIDEHWDWSDPYMVTVPMMPIKKTIRVTAEDADTAEPMENVKLKIIASEDITISTDDVRYKSGDVVDEITTDESGYAESKELYIGKYHIKQDEVPEYYAVDSKAYDASVSESADEETGLVKITCQKTAVTVRLIDERTEEPIKDAVYSMEDRDDYVTDANGEFTVTDLQKMTSYELQVKSVPDGYLKKEQTLSFSVDVNGQVNDKPAPVIDDTAYSISLKIDVKDKLFGRASKGIDLQLLDESENILDEWTTNDQTYILNGLSEGTYYVQRSGKPGSRMTVHVKDTAELQTAQMLIWDTIDLFALLMAAGSLIVAGLFIVFLISRRKRVKN